MDVGNKSTSNPAVVFVHGFLGFNEIRLPYKRVTYFRGVKNALSDIGINCYFPRLPAGASIIERAKALAAFLEPIPEQKIILIAHSMGGLDSRYVISRLDPARRICRLITIGTPHRGTALAEWTLKTPRLINTLARWLGRPGLEDLRRDTCNRFNSAVPNRSDVEYSSYAALRPINEIPILFRRWAKIIAAEEGPDNDSQVSVESAKWGDFKGTLVADHLELLGWNLNRRHKPQPFDHIQFYRNLVSSVAIRRGPAADT
ncbi:MAG: esterase/lipase family protein [Acidiferrobacterales bacterium]